MTSACGPPGPGTPPAAIPAQAALLWPVARAVVSAQVPASPVRAAIIAALNAMNPTAAHIGSAFRSANLSTLTFEPSDPKAVQDIGEMQAEISQVLELGYNGIINDRFRLSGAFWYEKKRDFVGPLIVESPNIFLDPSTTGAFFAGSPAWQALAQQLVPVIGPAAFQELTTQVVTGLVSVPLATIVPDSPLTQTGDLFLTYRNFGSLDLWGTDLGFDYLFSDRFSITGMWSHVSDDFFSAKEVDGPTDVALNASFGKGCGLRTVPGGSRRLGGRSRRAVHQGVPGQLRRVRHRAQCRWHPARDSGLDGVRCAGGLSLQVRPDGIALGAESLQ